LGAILGHNAAFWLPLLQPANSFGPAGNLHRSQHRISDAKLADWMKGYLSREDLLGISCGRSAFSN
jgi:hypothetical protein